MLTRAQVVGLLTGTLSAVGRLVNPDLRFVVLPESGIREGEIRLTTKGCEVANWSEAWPAILGELRSSFPGALVIEGVPRTRSGTAKIVVGWRNPTSTQNQVASWFAKWLVSVHASGEVCGIVNRVAVEQEATEQKPVACYRGEPALYQRMRSTLARSLDTTSPAVLATETRRRRDQARRRLAVSQAVHVSEAIQHIGGKSNYIDFTRSPWTALWFASQGPETAEGRVWALQFAAPGLEFCDGSEIDVESARHRVTAQQSVLVESKSGEIRHAELREVCRIPGNLKDKILKFLLQVSVTEESLFPDLLGHVSSKEEDGMPLETFVALMREKLENQQYSEVEAITRSALARSEGDDVNERALLYLRALALVFLRRPVDALDGLLAVKQIYEREGRSLPTVIQKNTKLVRLASRSGDMSRIGKRLDLTMDESLLSVSLGPFRFSTDERTDYTQAIEDAVAYHVASIRRS